MCVICVLNPVSGEVELFRQRSLPFGASAAVLGFNWVATGLCAILQALLAVGCTNFYDDFTVFEVTGATVEVAKVVEDFFELLGWDLKELPEFSTEVSALGAVFDLHDGVRRKNQCLLQLSVMPIRVLADGVH